MVTAKNIGACLAALMLWPLGAAAQEAPVMLRLELAVCQRLVPDFPIEELSTGHVTVEGETTARRWPSVPIRLPADVARRWGLIDLVAPGAPRLLMTGLESDRVVVNGQALPAESRAPLADICRQLAEIAKTG